jgi:hypothetical protein
LLAFVSEAGGVVADGRGLQKKCSFLKKRTKKLLRVWFRVKPISFAPSSGSEGARVFCFFFSKKKTFLS